MLASAITTETPTPPAAAVPNELARAVWVLSASISTLLPAAVRLALRAKASTMLSRLVRVIAPAPAPPREIEIETTSAFASMSWLA